MILIFYFCFCALRLGRWDGYEEEEVRGWKVGRLGLIEVLFCFVFCMFGGYGRGVWFGDWDWGWGDGWVDGWSGRYDFGNGCERGEGMGLGTVL